MFEVCLSRGLFMITARCNTAQSGLHQNAYVLILGNLPTFGRACLRDLAPWVSPFLSSPLAKPLASGYRLFSYQFGPK